MVRENHAPDAPIPMSDDLVAESRPSAPRGTTTRVRSPGLDGLRGIAILMVLEVHLVYPWALALSGGPNHATAPLFEPTYGYTLLAVAYAGLLLIAVTERRGPVTAVLRSRLLGRIGLISYAVYLFHLPVFGLVSWLLPARAQVGLPSLWYHVLVAVITLAISILVASLSWRFFEKRFINWGHTFQYERASGPARQEQAGPPEQLVSIREIGAIGIAGKQMS